MPSLKAGQLIKLARTTRRYTQAEVAHEYGCGLSTFKRWESGVIEPPYSDVHGIVEMLGYTVGELQDANC